MPRELIVLGIALVFGAWFVLDQRSFSDKMGLLVMLTLFYIGYRWLSGDSLMDIINPVIQFFRSLPPPTGNENQ